MKSVARSEHRWLLACLGLYGLTLCLLGHWLHPVAMPGGEYDLYVERAESLLAGTLTNDAFHGMLFPELVALTTLALGNAFAAGRVVTHAAAIAVLYVLYRWIRQHHGPRPAVWTCVLLAVNAQFVLLSLQACSDMTATAFLAAAAWLGCRYSSHRHVVAAAGLCLGLALATRPSSMPLAPLFLAVVAANAGRGIGLRAFAGATFGLGLFVGWLPHAIPTWLQFGSPFANESWRVLDSKLCHFDVQILVTPRYEGMLDLLTHEFGALLRLFVQDFWRLWTEVLGAWLAGGCMVRAFAVSTTALALAACLWHLWRRQHLPILSFVLLHTLLIAFTFVPGEGMLLPIVPWVLALVVIAGFACARRWPLAVHALAAVYATTLAGMAPATLAEFARQHPTAEIAAAERVQQEHGATVTLISTYAAMQRHVSARVWTVSPPLPATYSTATMWQIISKTANEVGADYFLTSTASFWYALPDLAAQAPAGHTVRRLDDGVLLVQLPRLQRDWLQRAEVTRAADGNSIDCYLALVEMPDLLGVGFTVFAPDGTSQLLALPSTGPREYRATLPTPPTGGRWRFVPACMLRDGRVLRGTAIELALP